MVHPRAWLAAGAPASALPIYWIRHGSSSRSRGARRADGRARAQPARTRFTASSRELDGPALPGASPLEPVGFRPHERHCSSRSSSRISTTRRSTLTRCSLVEGAPDEPGRARSTTDGVDVEAALHGRVHDRAGGLADVRPRRDSRSPRLLRLRVRPRLRPGEGLMSAGDTFGLGDLAARARVSRLRAVPRRAVLDERSGNRPDPRLRRRAVALGYPLGFWMAHVYTAEAALASSAASCASSTRQRPSRTGRATRRRSSSSASLFLASST